MSNETAAAAAAIVPHAIARQILRYILREFTSEERYTEEMWERMFRYLSLESRPKHQRFTYQIEEEEFGITYTVLWIPTLHGTFPKVPVARFNASKTTSCLWKFEERTLNGHPLVDFLKVDPKEPEAAEWKEWIGPPKNVRS